MIDVQLSGDGIIPQSAFIPGSGLPTRYDFLELYLVSSQSKVNITVSTGTGLLSQEPGSTVKHLSWPMPDCLTPGIYNVKSKTCTPLCHSFQTSSHAQLTVYEGAHINNNVCAFLSANAVYIPYALVKAFFSITPISISIANAQVSKNASQCLSNPLQQQPQPESAPAINPYNDPNSGVNADNAVPSTTTSPVTFTITVGSSGLPSVWSILSTGAPTGTPTQAMTTVTVVMVSSDVLTETLTMPKTSLITTTYVIRPSLKSYC